MTDSDNGSFQIAKKDRRDIEPRRQPMALHAQPLPVEVFRDKLFSLNRRLTLLVQRRQGCIVQFASAQAGRESSKLTLEYARLVSQRLNQKVLLLAIGDVPYHLTNGADRSKGPNWDGVITGRSFIDEHIRPVNDSSLFYGQMGPSKAALPDMVNDPQFDVLLNSLRGAFDMVVVDCPPLCESSIAARMATTTDGVVLIVEAGKTRWQVVKHQIKEIQANNGTILGVVLNKRRYYIPEFIYKRL